VIYYGALLGVVVLLATLRSAPRSTFAIAVVAMVYATPVVRLETLAIAVVAIAPWLAGAGRVPTIRRMPFIEATTVAVVIGAAIGVSVARGGLDRSSVALVNASEEPATFRIYMPWQAEATFGFTVAPGSTGLAWVQRGALPGPVVVFDPDCRSRGLVWPSRTGGVIRLSATGSLEAADEPMPEAALLAYSTECAGTPFPGPTIEVAG
jgi:hypothetical protein